MKSCRVIVWSSITSIAACAAPLDDFDGTEVASCDEAGPAGGLAQRAYLKASNPGAGDYFGHSIALSADGTILAVGAYDEDSAATGVGGSQADNSADAAGAVYVFERKGRRWLQQAYIKASNAGALDAFGHSVALSADGSILAVGAPLESSAASGVGGDQTSDGASYAGAAYVFVRRDARWAQEAYLKASHTGPADNFGHSVALSADGSTLAVGAPFEDSAATGVGGDAADNSADAAGAVHVYARDGAAWSHQAYVKAENTGAGDRFGSVVALSADGSILAAGAPFEDSAAGPADDAAPDAGAVHVLERDGAAWRHQAFVKALVPGAGDGFGGALALSADGSLLAVGARGEDGPAGATVDAGAVHVLVRDGAAWSHQAHVTAGNAGAGDGFGASVALSSDGTTLAVGASAENGAATGLDGDPADDSAAQGGAVYTFACGAAWIQRAYVKASNTGVGDAFGAAVALSANGSALAASANGEDSSASGIDGDQTDDSAPYSGAVYMFR